MSEIQILTLVASLLGILGGLANLVTFAREKEKGHKKAVLILLTLLVTPVVYSYFDDLRELSWADVKRVLGNLKASRRNARPGQAPGEAPGEARA